MKKLIYIITLVFPSFLFSQVEEESLSSLVNDDFGLISLNVSYGYQIPLADLGNRFGSHFEIGSDLDYITAKSNLIFGLAGRFMFGDDVKEDPIAFLRNSDGSVTLPDQVTTPIFLRMRATYLGAHVGKLIPLSERHKLHNVRATLGMGLLQHRIRLLDETNTSPYRQEPYISGVDRLTNGLALRQQLGYQRIDRDGFLHFYVGVEATQGFTSSRRDIDLQLGVKDTKQRLDMLIGARIAIMLSLSYTSDTSRVYYY